MIEAAMGENLTAFLGRDADSSILKGYEAQRDLILTQYASVKSAVQETAFGGGDTVSIAMLKPLSRGSILINSTDPLAAPVFDYNTFAHPMDLNIAIQALKKVRQWMVSGPVQELGASEVFLVVQVQSDEEIAGSICTFATSI